MTDRSLRATRESDKTVIEGVLYEADQSNINGIIYSKEAMRKAVDDYQEQIRAKKAVVTLGNGCGQPVRLANVAALVTGLEMDESGIVRMRAELLDTPPGGVVEREITRVTNADGPYRGSAKLDLGFAAAGFGTVEDNHVTDDFTLTSVDIVPVDELGQAGNVQAPEVDGGSERD